MNLHSLRSWYYNGRATVINWRRNKDFYHEIINLAEHFPQVEFLIKSKQYDWLDIPYFKEISRQLYQKKNIRILSDQKNKVRVMIGNTTATIRKNNKLLYCSI